MDADLLARRDELVNRQGKKQATVKKLRVGQRAWGTITAITAGPPPTLTVDSNGASIPGLHYLDIGVEYAVNDYVMMENVAGNVVVLGRMTSSLTDLAAPRYPERIRYTASHAMLAADLGARIVMDDASACTFTFESALTLGVTIPVNETLEFYVPNTGQLTLVAGSGVTFAPSTKLKSSAPDATIGAIHDGGDKWVLSGDLTA